MIALGDIWGGGVSPLSFYLSLSLSLSFSLLKKLKFKNNYSSVEKWVLFPPS